MIREFGECAMSKAVQDVCDERERQIEDEGWSVEHDDSHVTGEMASAAGCYLLFGQDHAFPAEHPPIRFWPWDAEWWKPKDKRRNLVRAGALVIAEIERMDRQEQREKSHATEVGQV